MNLYEPYTTEVLRGLGEAGLSTRGGRALALGSPELASWAAEQFKPMTVDALGILPDDGQDTGGYDLILAGRGLEDGPLSAVVDRLMGIGRLLTATGLAVLRVDAMAARLKPSDASIPVAPYDALLFPHAAAMGDLGDQLSRKIPIPPLAWRLLLARAGFKVTETFGAGASPLPSELVQRHHGRLRYFDPLELSAAELVYLVRLVGDGA